MKQKIYILLAGLFLLTMQVKAQAPNAFNYQGVARQADGSVMPNTALGLRFTIHQTSQVGTIVYQEEQSATTNQFGLFSVAVGSGIVLSGSMSSISWGANSYYLQVEMDPTGGTIYTNMGANQLLSVPYALYAVSSGTKPVTYSAGNGIGITDTVISANSFDALWNANKLQGDSVSVTKPADGQVLAWTGTAWAPVTPAGLGWNLTGNSGTTAGTDFVGTTDDNDLVLKANNKEGLRINHTSGNVGVGTAAPAEALDVEGGNIQFGKALMPGGNAGSVGDILQSNGTNTAPTWVSGGWALAGNSGTNYPNNYIGTTDDNAIQFEVNSNEAGLVEDYDGGAGGNGNTGLGYQALINNYNNGGNQNTAVGFNAMYNSEYSSSNVGIGYQALYADYSTSNNTAVGYQALFQNDQYFDEEAYYNTALGSQALYSNIDASNNVAVGYQALYNNDNDDYAEANQNTAIGTYALNNDVDGSSNTAIGYNANLGYYDQGNPVNNSTAIGANATVNSSNTVQLGSGASVQFDQALMPFNGTSYDPGGVGEVLQSNGPGTAPTWVVSSGGGGAWALNGNNGTVYPTNYLGTTDDNGLAFVVNGSIAGRVEDFDYGAGGVANTSLGYQALSQSSPGQQNTAVGYQALQANATGGVGYNVALGYQTMQDNVSGEWNTGLGTLALQALTNGSYNIGVGPGSISGNSNGSYNIGIGQNALNNGNGSNNIAIGFHSAAENQISGSYNDGIGIQVLYALTNGSNNDAMGYLALGNLQNASNDVAVGYTALYNDDYTGSGSGQYNTAIGSQSLFSNVDAAYNTALGYQSLYQNDQYDDNEAYNNTGLGAQALYSDIDATNNTAVGYQALYNDDYDDNNSASYNTAVGTLALSNDVDGSSNTAIGFNANFSSNDQGDPINNSSAIGANSIVNTSNTIQLGNGCSIQFDQALAPYNGSVYDPGQAGYVLQSNGPGTAPTWVASSGGGGGASWNLAGNAIAYSYNVAPTTFLGTTNSYGFEFGVNGVEAGRVEANYGSQNTALGWGSLQNGTGSANTAMGINAAQLATGGSYNVSMGWEAFGDYSDGGSYNVAIGGGALAGPGGYTGDGVDDNTAVGYFALVSNDAPNNTALGYGAASSGLNSGPATPLTGSPITAIGYETLFNNTSGSDNVALGFQSLYSNTAASNNTAIGDDAQQSDNAGNNTAVGYQAMQVNSGSSNVAVGMQALIDASGNNNTAVGFQSQQSIDINEVSGNYNTALGSTSQWKMNSGSYNTGVGYYTEENLEEGNDDAAYGSYSLQYNYGGSYETSIGDSTLKTDASGSYNTALGFDADVAVDGLTNATAIGANAVVGESNAVVLGSTGVNVGINTSTPNSSLQISGGTMSLPITVSASSVNLSTSPNTYTVIITATGQTVTLPTASTVTGRVYVIVAQMASGSLTTSSFLNLNGVATTSISAGVSITLQSDGTNWDQIK